MLLPFKLLGKGSSFAMPLNWFDIPRIACLKTKVIHKQRLLISNLEIIMENAFINSGFPIREF